MNVPERDTLRDTLPAMMLRYVLAALCLAVAAWGFIALPVHADCGPCSAPPPPPRCDCQPATIVMPAPNVPTAHAMMNNSASAQANAQSFSVAVARTPDITVRTGGVSDTSVSVGASASAAFNVEERLAVSSADMGRAVRIQAFCLDVTNHSRPASPTFASETVPTDFVGEIYRCALDTHAMRVRVQGQSFDCAASEALWYEHAQLSCKVQMQRNATKERALIERVGASDKIVLLRAPESASRAMPLNAAMAMDGGVGFN